MFEGVLKSAGQVYAVDHLIASIIILIALILNSPLLTVGSFLGGLLSSLIGIYFYFLTMAFISFYFIDSLISRKHI